jgi:hypothetical protein
MLPFTCKIKSLSSALTTNPLWQLEKQIALNKQALNKNNNTQIKI